MNKISCKHHLLELPLHAKTWTWAEQTFTIQTIFRSVRRESSMITLILWWQKVKTAMCVIEELETGECIQ